MKRLLALIMSLILLLSVPGIASAAKIMQPFENEYFKIFIPGDWIISLSSVQDYWGAIDLGYTYSPDESMLLQANLYFYGDWAQDSLWAASNDTWNDYIEFIMDDLKDENPELIGTIYAGKFPGVIIRGTNDAGTYLYGEIMVNAYAYGFYFYLLNEDGTVNSDVTQEDGELFQSILETFTLNY